MKILLHCILESRGTSNTTLRPRVSFKTHEWITGTYLTFLIQKWSIENSFYWLLLQIPEFGGPVIRVESYEKMTFIRFQTDTWKLTFLMAFCRWSATKMTLVGFYSLCLQFSPLFPSEICRETFLGFKNYLIFCSWKGVKHDVNRLSKQIFGNFLVLFCS